MLLDFAPSIFKACLIAQKLLLIWHKHHATAVVVGLDSKGAWQGGEVYLIKAFVNPIELGQIGADIGSKKGGS